jgi:hypothetical protein
LLDGLGGDVEGDGFVLSSFKDLALPEVKDYLCCAHSNSVETTHLGSGDLTVMGTSKRFCSFSAITFN